MSRSPLDGLHYPSHSDEVRYLYDLGPRYCQTRIDGQFEVIDNRVVWAEGTRDNGNQCRQHSGRDNTDDNRRYGRVDDERGFDDQ